MNVLIIGPVPPNLGSHNTGGIARHVWALARELKGEGHEVSILAIGRYFKKTRFVEGIKVLGIQKLITSIGHSLIKIPGMFAEIGFIPTKKPYFHTVFSLLRINTVGDLNEYDIIHLHGLHNAALYALKVLKIHTPKIVTIHSYTDFISSDKTKSLERMKYVNNYLKLSNGIVHVSKADRKKGREYGLVFDSKDKIIHNGVKKGSGNAFDCRSGICFVGYLIKQKRISLFLESIKFTKSDFREVFIAGEGALQEEVEDTAQSNPIILYKGVITNEEVRKMMRENSLLVVPSTSESFGLVYIEALFEGMAVLGFGPVIKEFHEVMELTEQEKKLVVAVTPAELSARTLAEKIDVAYQFRRSPEGKEAMSRVREKAIQNFSWDAIIGRVVNTYREIIKEN